MFYENNGKAAKELILEKAGEYWFCSNCEHDSVCDHVGGKITARALYVLRYLYEHDAGIQHYPLPGSWEYQPHWFIEMFMSGRAVMSEVRAEKVERKK